MQAVKIAREHRVDLLTSGQDTCLNTVAYRVQILAEEF